MFISLNWSKWLGIPENFSEHGGNVDHLIDIVHWFMFALFLGWTLFFFVCCWKFRASKNPKASYHGVTSHVSSHLEIGVVIIEAVLLLGFAFPLWWERTDQFDLVQKTDPVRVRVIGYQFAFNYHYPGNDGKFGRIDRHLVSGPGDPCLDPDDPNGWDDFVASSLKLPVDRNAILQVTSTDVIHNYSIIPMRIQQDALPGRDIPMWFKPIKKLETYVVCGQLCGEKHADMRGLMQVVSQKAYSSWAKTKSEEAYKAKTASQDAGAVAQK
ncbi:cytochrome c oxidase subunit II [Akkermansiaceae bacterium]|nr:cytochrome c oxidase subunit II [Akkermansiaceae bacterium]MDA7935971.1 cytochrome c oxidase subunit II [bacterium]MDB4258078.1 cytochrome c oxidase subunit II [Akkermansiaceae bacterium]MDB4276079.1 cytochrome c oxidase subunit II [Akkermansiaceae bacterium]MDB4287717.1 cytochrome c oxidase subunit II [bacterium]